MTTDPDIRDSSKKELIFGKANEQIYCLAGLNTFPTHYFLAPANCDVEWNMEIDNKPHRYIVLGTDYINVTTSNVHKGRVLILSVTIGPNGKVEVRRRFQISCDAPVYSLAPYGTK